MAHESEVADFESLASAAEVGPRTLQSLTLVPRVIHGTPSGSPPGAFLFAHGGRDRHPFPVPTEIYDRTMRCSTGPSIVHVSERGTRRRR